MSTSTRTASSSSSGPTPPSPAKDSVPPEQHTVGFVASAVLGSLVDEMILDTVVDVHKQHRTVSWNGPTAVDVFGNDKRAALLKTFTCHVCKRLVNASKYAPHLEKCLNVGRGVRASRARRPVQTPPASSSATGSAAQTASAGITASASAAGSAAGLTNGVGDGPISLSSGDDDDADDDPGDSDFEPGQARRKAQQQRRRGNAKKARLS